VSNPLLAYQTAIKLGGTSTAMTGEACANVDSGLWHKYQITNAVKRAIDWNQPITVKKNGTAQTSTLYSVDYCNGFIFFFAALINTDVVTIDGNYIPTSLVALARATTVEGSAAYADVSVFGNTAKAEIPAMPTLAITVDTVHVPADIIFGAVSLLSALESGAPLFLEISFGAGAKILHAWCVPQKGKFVSKLLDALTTGLEFDGVVQTCNGRPGTDQAMWGWAN